MGKYITESDKDYEGVSIGESAYFQDQGLYRVNKGDRVFIKANQYAYEGEFSPELLECYKDSFRLAGSQEGGPVALSDSIRTPLFNSLSAFKRFFWNQELTLNGYTFAPSQNSATSGTSLERRYVRYDPVTHSASMFQIPYLSAGSFQSITQSNGAMIMASNGSKLFAYFRGNDDFLCYTSTDGKTWTDESSSFNLTTTIDVGNIYTSSLLGGTTYFNSFGGVSSSNANRYFDVTWCGNAFLMKANDLTNGNCFYTSTDGLTWTDISSTVYNGSSVPSADTMSYVCNVDVSTSKSFIRGHTSAGLAFGAYSHDGGTTWTTSSTLGSTANYINRLYKNPLDSNKFLAIYSNDTGPLIIKTTDGGINWDTVSLPFTPKLQDYGGLAYFGDYIYVGENASPMYGYRVSPDNGATWEHFDQLQTAMSSPRMFCDGYRLYIYQQQSLAYTTDNSTWLVKTQATNIQNNLYGAVSIDANKTLFLTYNDRSWTITDDGAATFSYIWKVAGRGNFVTDCRVAGLAMDEIGYLSNAKMLATNSFTQLNTGRTNAFWTDWIYDPIICQVNNGGPMTSSTDDRITYIRTK